MSGSVAGNEASTPDEASILAALLAPAGRFVEPGCLPPPRLPERAELALALQTGTAWRIGIAAVLRDALRRRLHLAEAPAEDIHIALHEAVVNAVVHGNLGISSAGRGSLEGLGAFLELVERRLQIPRLAARAVTVLVVRDAPDRIGVEVSDCGEGFVPAGPAPAVPATRPHGRGLLLIRMLSEHCEWRQETRTLAMRFRLSPSDDDSRCDPARP
ncbi:ATP-binding protein [Rhodovastum atsumiense]|uniref:ATP-binding protein n=1 Tax=Rhodovastum atsumiense TaxID=504468 RepID=UPI00139F29A1|nr:ATP-binding protein [Rhodovastum atsumiense]CAH2603088.1 ATP-binding protein [Rhodovastum atsumiense]